MKNILMLVSRSSYYLLFYNLALMRQPVQLISIKSRALVSIQSAFPPYSSSCVRDRERPFHSFPLLSSRPVSHACVRCQVRINLLDIAHRDYSPCHTFPTANQST